MATDPNRPGHGGAASSPLISSLSGVDGEGAPYAPPPSPIIAAPASSSTVSAATSAPSTGAYLGETSGITGHRLGQEYASVPSSSGIAFVSFGLLPREVLSTDLRLDLGSVFAASHMTNSSSAFGYANSSDLSSPSHDLMQAQQQQSGRRPEAPRAGCPTRSRISGGSSSGSQLDHLPPPADAGAAVADMVLATTAPPPPTTSSAQAQAQQANVTRDMWLACAAPKSGRLPTVGSLVYYFPDGHAEQCPSRPPEPLPGRIFLCKVTDVRLYATTWNEPVANIFLVPVAADDHALQLQAPADPGAAPDQNLVSFVKPLTNTDAVKNRYRFIVPKKDAAAGVLPHLELNDNVLLRIKDLKGKEWVFNYTWKEHTRKFRSGWMDFARANHLVTGDNVVFMRRMDDGEMFMGVRRTLNRSAPCSVEEVINAVWRAARREPFHVNYWSRQDGDEFVVPRDVVDDGLRARFAPGMVVNFVWAVEEGKLPTIGPQGKVIAIESYASSIWRMMQVEWASSAEMNRHVNFWQIRPVLGESSSQATVKLQDDSQAPHKNSVNALQLPDGTNQLQHKTSASSSSIEEPPSFRLFGQTMTPGVPPRRDSRGPSLQPIANDEDEQVPTMRKRLEALLPDNI